MKDFNHVLPRALHRIFFSFFSLSVPIGDLHKVSNYKNYKIYFWKCLSQCKSFQLFEFQDGGVGGG